MSLPPQLVQMARRVVSVLVVLGVAQDGRKHLVALRLAASEAGTHWSSLIADRQRRGLEEAGELLLTFCALPKAMWRALRTTNTLENLNREFRRRTKTQASFSSEESAVTLLYALVAFGQIQLRKIDGYHHVSELLAPSLATAA